MPVRKIPKNYRNVTGLVATDKAEAMTGYESRLEHDCQKLVGFNINVLKYEEQPVQIHYIARDGRRHSYTPDILIYYRTDVGASKQWRPLLAEIKYRSDLLNNWAKLKPKLVAGRDYANDRDWNFAVITDREIYTPYLKNAIFLLEYRKYPINEADTELLLDTLKATGDTDPTTLLALLTDDSIRKAELLPTLWQLVSNHRIQIDLEKPLQMRSRIRPAYFAKELDDEIIFCSRAGRARRIRWQALRYNSYSDS